MHVFTIVVRTFVENVCSILRVRLGEKSRGEMTQILKLSYSCPGSPKQPYLDE